MSLKAADWIYAKGPVFVQNLAVSIYGLFYKHERLGGRFRKYAAGFKERTAFSPEQMNQYVEGELRKTLLIAYHHLSFYRDSWGKAGLKESDLQQMKISNLYKIPTAPKKYFRENPEAFLVKDPGKSHRFLKYFTSGSTGTPITCFYTRDSHQKFIAAREARSFNWAGVSVKMPRAMIGGRMVVPGGISKPPFYRYNAAESQIYLSAFHIAPKNISDYVRGLNRHKPEVFTGYAYSYYFLARMMKENNLRLAYSPRAIILGSEKMTPEMKSVLREVFQAPVYEEYGAVENCFLATECREGRLHVHPDFGILEVVDEKGMPLPAGEKGNIVCTGLSNDVQLFIRYETGDEGTFSKELCPCGRNHLPVLKEVSGRIEDTVTGLDGRQMVRFHGLFVDMSGILEGQVIQEKLDEFRVLIVASSSFRPEDEEIIRKRFFERLGNVKVSLERVSAIERTSRGKFQAVISRVNNRES